MLYRTLLIRKNSVIQHIFHFTIPSLIKYHFSLQNKKYCFSVGIKQVVLIIVQIIAASSKMGNVIFKTRCKNTFDKMTKRNSNRCKEHHYFSPLVWNTSLLFTVGFLANPSLLTSECTYSHTGQNHLFFRLWWTWLNQKLGEQQPI